MKTLLDITKTDYDWVRHKPVSSLERILAAKDLRLPDTRMVPEMEQYIENLRHAFAEYEAEAVANGGGDDYRGWLLNQFIVADLLETHKDDLKKALSH